MRGRVSPVRSAVAAKAKRTSRHGLLRYDFSVRLDEYFGAVSQTMVQEEFVVVTLHEAIVADIDATGALAAADVAR